jgi:uncharacterized protein YxeA
MKYILLFITILLTISCAAKLIRFDQYSVTMNLTVEPDSSLFIGNDEAFTGVLFLAPILHEEKMDVDRVKLIKNYGKYYLCAEKFKNIWMIEPKDDGLTANYRPIDVTPKEKGDSYKEISFSRYGDKENVMIKFKFNKREIFIDRKGNLHEKSK